MATLLQANSIRVQKQLSKYKSKKEFADALHMIRFSIGLKTPKYVKRFINWCAEMNGNANSAYGTGAFFHEIETIAEEMECSTKTVQRALTWLKKHGLLFTYDSFNYKESKTGADYKVFASFKDIQAMIKTLVEQEKQDIIRKMSSAESQNRVILETEKEEIESQNHSILSSELSSEVSSEVSSASVGENPAMPTDESPKNGEHKRPNIKDPYKTPISTTNNNKSILENDSFSSPDSDKKYFLKKETKAILREAQKEMRNDGLEELTEEEAETCGNKIQLFAHVYGVKIVDIHDMAVETIYNSTNHDSNDFGGYIYRSLENGFIDGLIGSDVIQEMIDNREYEELDEMRENMKEAYREGAAAIQELAASFEAKPKKTAFQAKRKQNKKGWSAEQYYQQNPICKQYSPLDTDWQEAKQIFRELKEKESKARSEEEIQAQKAYIEKMLKKLRDEEAERNGYPSYAPSQSPEEAVQAF